MSYNACLVNLKSGANAVSTVLDCSGLPIRVGDCVSLVDSEFSGVYTVDQVLRLPLPDNSSVDCVTYSYTTRSGSYVRICVNSSKLTFVSRKGV